MEYAERTAVGKRTKHTEGRSEGGVAVTKEQTERKKIKLN